MTPDPAELTRSGLQAMQSGQYEEAARAFGEAIRVAPAVDGLYFQLASALLWRGLPTEALPALDRCASMHGAWAEHATELAMRIRRQLALPVHGMMIMPGPAPPRPSPPPARKPREGPPPATTLTGTPSSDPELAQALAAVSSRVLGEAAPSRVVPTVVLRLLARVAHADGVLDPREVEYLVHVAKAMELGEGEARRILEDELTRRSDAAALARQIPSESRREVFGMLCTMAVSEGSVPESERELLDAYARAAGLDGRTAEEILASAAAAAASRT